MTSGPLAIFDLDRTLHAGSGLGVLARFAFRRRLIGPQRMARSLVHDLIFRKLGASDGHIGSIAELALDMAQGLTEDELGPVVSATAADIACSVRPGMRVLLEEHLAAGDYCVLLSTSPQPLVEEIAELLNVHRGIGTVVEIDDGVLTGRIEEPLCYGQGKLERLASEIGWSGDEQRKSSYAYADSMSDLPLLESVHSPIVVAPDRRLRRLAEEREWPVIEF